MKKKVELRKRIAFIIVLFLLLLSTSLNFFLLFRNDTNNYFKAKDTENIVFFGDSLTARYDLKKYFPKRNLVNKGVGAEKTEDLLNRIDKDVYEYNPSKVFVQVGINDVVKEVDEEDMLANLQTIITGIKINRGSAKIYVESLYPVNEDKVKESSNEMMRKLNNKDIKILNSKIKSICLENDVIYVDMFNRLLDKKGNLKELYTNDGVHMTNLGYLKVTSVLQDYLN